MTEPQSAAVSTTTAVEMRVPADPAMSKVVRLAAAGLASLRNFTLLEIDDVKLAVSEALIVLVEHGAGHPVAVRFLVDLDAFVLEASTVVDHSFDPADSDLELCRVVLADLCTEHAVEAAGERLSVRAVLRRPFPGS